MKMKTRISAGLLLCGFALLALTACGIADITDNIYSYEEAETYTPGTNVNTAGITNLSLDWIEGQVVIIASDTATDLTLSEQKKNIRGELSQPTEEEVLYTRVVGDTLEVKYAANGADTLEIDPKVLTVTVPVIRVMSAVQIDTVSAKVAVSDIRADVVKADTVSGNVEVSRVTGREMTFSTTSGSVTVSGGSATAFTADTVSGNVTLQNAVGIQTLNADTVSGAVYYACSGNLPGEIGIDTVSGRVELILPSNGQFATDYETTSGTYLTNFQETVDGNRHTVGTANSIYRVDTVSGNLSVLQTLIAE